MPVLLPRSLSQRERPSALTTGTNCGSGFLCRNSLAAGNFIGCRSTQIRYTAFDNLRNSGKSGGQIRDRLIGPLEVKRAGQISHRCAPPSAQIWHFSAEQSFEKPQYGSVVKQIRGYEAAATERRDDQQGDAKAQTNRTADRWAARYRRVRHRRRRYIFSGRPGRRRNRRQVIEKSAILVEVNQQNCFGPQRWIRAQRTHDKRKNILAKDGRRRRVIGGYDRSDQPGNLRQIPGRHVREKVHRELWSERILMQHRGRVLKIFEVGQHIVRKNSAKNGFVRRRINLPGNSTSLQLLGHGRVGQTAIKSGAISDDRLQNRPAVFSIWVQRGRHGVQAVRIGGTDYRTKIVVANRESVRQRVVVRNIRARVVTHA